MILFLRNVLSKFLFNFTYREADGIIFVFNPKEKDFLTSLIKSAQKILEIKEKEWKGIIPGLVVSNNIGGETNSEEFLKNISLCINTNQEFDVYEVNTESNETTFLEKSFITAVRSIQRSKLTRKPQKRRSLFDKLTPISECHASNKRNSLTLEF